MCIAIGNSEKCGKAWIPARYVMVILAFCGFFCNYAMRVNMSVAILAMVNNSGDAQQEVGQSKVCPSRNGSNSNQSDIEGEFNWDSQLQGIILGSLFYGYILTEIPGAWLARKFGPKLPFGLSALLSGILALLTPLAAKWHVGALIATRVLQGLCQGVSFPSIHTMLSLWAPPLERTKLSTIVYTGTHMGTVGALVLSGILIEKWGWESVFYFFGALSCFWFIFWFFLAFDSPDSHPRISQAERIYINTAIGRPRISDDGAAAVSIPWRSMLTSVPVWAIFAGHIGFTWGLYTLLTNLPTFFSKVLHFRLKENGVMSALPYIALVVVMPIAGFAADALRSHNVLSTTSVRRLFQFAGSIIPAACLIAVGYVGCNVYAAVAVMIVAVASIGLAESGYQVNYLDLSPTYCGILMGLGNTLATIPGIVSPYIVGIITSGPAGRTTATWRIVFFIAAGIYVVTATIYVIFTSSNLAKWELKKTDGSLETQNSSICVPLNATKKVAC